MPLDLQEPWHGAPKWVWVGGGTVVVFGGYILWKRHQAAKAAASSTGATTSGQGIPSGYDLTTGPAGMGWLGGSSPTGSIVGYDSNGNPIYSGFPGASVPPGPTPAPPGTPPPATGPPAPVVGAGNAADQYAIGQTVNPSSGEKIVAAMFSPVYGWINETNLGGIYTGGGGQPGKSIGQLPYGGSYLGYVAQKYGVGTPAAKAEIATHGTFGPGGLLINPGGGYTQVNTRGERYQEGP